MTRRNNRVLYFVLAAFSIVAIAAYIKKSAETKSRRTSETQKSNPDAKREPSGKPAMKTTDCNKLWEMKVAREPQGTILGHETLVEMALPDGTAANPNGMKTTIVSTAKILESDINKVVTERTTTLVNPGISRPPRSETVTETRATWIAQCKSAVGDGFPPPFNSGFDVTYEGAPLIQRDERITVRGGAFAAHYVKRKIRWSGSMTNGSPSASKSEGTSEGTSEVWYIGDGMASLVVKSITVGTVSASIGNVSVPVDRKIVHELTEYLKP